jgi:hypothetical protein
VTKALNIRVFPEDLRRELKAHAALQRISLRDIVIRYCQEGLERDKKTKKGG